MYNSGSNNLGLLLYYCKKIIYETAGAYARCHKILPEYFNDISDNNFISLMLTDSSFSKCK